MGQSKPTVAVHKFSSCDGCQLAFLNMGEALLDLTQQVELVHFLEAGIVNEERTVDIAFVEGSISTSQDLERIRSIRNNSKLLITIGACATSGGLQALRNFNDAKAWTAAIYAQPQFVDSLDKATPIKDHVRVDFELWGCPISSRQIIATVRALLLGVLPSMPKDKVCLECKRQQQVCVMVARDEPCMGVITQTGCGALCPGFGRDCYGCYGPAENSNPGTLANRLQGLGLQPSSVARRFLYIHSATTELNATGLDWLKTQDS